MYRPLPLRREQPPDEATIVVRAGVLDADAVVRAASRTFEIHAIYGISVLAALDQTVAEACRDVRVAAYRHIRLSTFGRLRAAGFPLLASFDRPHFTLVLPDLSELTIARLSRCFDPPLPNPAGPAPR